MHRPLQENIIQRNSKYWGTFNENVKKIRRKDFVSLACQVLVKENLFACTAARDNLTSVQEILVRFWQQMTALT
jgi:hypothetical protein